MSMGKWNWEKRHDNYKYWGTYWEYQSIVNKNIFTEHEKHNHTDRCKFYAHPLCMTICKYTGEKIITDLERLTHTR